MSKEWNQASSITKEVISEKLSKCLHIGNDFVWVDMPEAVQEDQAPSYTHSGNVANLVQCTNHCTSFEKELSDQSEEDNEEILETEYVNQCIKNKDKAINPSREKYSKPYWMKIREHGIYSIKKKQFSKQQNNKLKSKEHINELLPKTKFDVSTTAVLEMLINNRYLGRYNEIIGTGKSSVVFHASCSRNNCITMPLNNAVKIYKTSKDENINKVVYKRVQREFEHMSTLRHTRALYEHVPQPVRAWKNVIVMGFVGCNIEAAAPSIEDGTFDRDEIMYYTIIQFMENCYKIKQLVHGKLSASRILFWLEKPWFIGWSHSVKRDHPVALTKLIKDCHFVTEFYKRRGVKVKPVKDLFQQITMQETSEKLLEIIQGKDLYAKYETNPNRKADRVQPTTSSRFKQ